MKKTLTYKEIIRILQEKKNPSMDPTVKTRMRNEMLTAFNVVTKNEATRYTLTQTNNHQSIFFTKPMVATIILSLLIVTGAGTAVAANNALPGDALYGVDRALEQTQLHFALSSTAKARVYIQIAEEREQEIQDLEEQDRPEDQNTAEEHEQQALQNAQTVITRVLEEHQEKEQSGKSVEALTNVQQKLSDLSDRFEERRNDQENGDSSSSDEEENDGEDTNQDDSNPSNDRSQNDDRKDNQEENNNSSVEVGVNAGLEVNVSSGSND